MTVRYLGRREEDGVRVVREGEDGTSGPLPTRLDLRNHSPTGFEWGYGGSGPAQLALALLADALGDERAQAAYQPFKFQVVARFPHPGWEITRGDIEAWWTTHEDRSDDRGQEP